MPSDTYSGSDGRVLEPSGETGTGLATAGVMLGLHVAQYAGTGLRWAYFLLGLTGAAMVGTGLLLWTSKRHRPRVAPFFGLKLVERLNIAVIVGLPIAMAAYLLANRLIPAAASGRADAEVEAMFWVWGGVALGQCVRTPQRAWAEGFALGAIAFGAIPLVNAVTTSRGLAASLASGDHLFAGFDLAMLTIATLLGIVAWRAGRVRAPHVPSRQSRRALHV